MCIRDRLYDDKETFHIRDILREPYYTYEHKNTAELFMDMRSSSISIAIVLDEYGATAGLITPVSYTHLDVYKRQRMNRSKKTLACAIF